ncbi:flagellar biosynthetic protein FliR [Caballeronia telluris]|uniref:Type III secretion-associated protein n=1 Tax=Caballeronia telluris TaxID=326475 RepID=A0A158EUM1_9BURK|nr:flagellar biosynthetic protein FliR [Caballeronia telluris]SAL10789.1 type III secretion-associated protein [Caballeronia telluris]
MLPLAATAWGLSTLLLCLRIGPLFVLAPPFSQLQIPLRVRVCLTFTIGACLADASPSTSLATMGNGELVVAACVELVLGLVIALAFQAAFGALSFAGRVVDVQAGYGLAMVIDPGSRQQAPLFGTMFTLVAGVMFFSLDGPGELLRLIAQFARILPPGFARVGIDAREVIAYMGLMMMTGLGAAAAIILSLFMIDIVIAFLSRTLPQMNALMLGLQVKTLATLVVASVSTGLIAPAVFRLINMALAFLSSLV